MKWRRIGAWVFVWALMLCHAEALSLVPWTDASRIEKADRIVIGTVEIKGDLSIIKVEKVLKGAAEPKRITTKMKPQRGDPQHSDQAKKVLWVDSTQQTHAVNPLTDLCYITEGSPKWLMYHALIDPAPLVENEVFAGNSDAMQLLGYLFDPVKITSRNAPIVAGRLMRYRVIADHLPWSDSGVLDLKCSLVPGDSERMRVDSMDVQSESAVITRDIIEHTPLDHMESSMPAVFSLRIDSRKIESMGSLSYEAAAGYLRRQLAMGLDASRGSDHDRHALKRAIREALISLKRMRDTESVPVVVLLAVQSDEDRSRAAFDFLASARDPRSLKPMCELLAEHAPKHPEKYWLSGGAAQVLGRIGDPAAVPFLEEGVRCGVQNAYYPLARISRVESMGIMIEAEKHQGFEGWAHGPLFWMVKRSNLETEPWMEPRQVNRGERSDELRTQWRKWWLAHKDEIKLVRTFEDATRGWEPQWRKEQRESKTHAKNHTWKYVVGVGAVLVFLFLNHVLRKRAATGNA